MVVSCFIRNSFSCVCLLFPVFHLHLPMVCLALICLTCVLLTVLSASRVFPLKILIFCLSNHSCSWFPIRLFVCLFVFLFFLSFGVRASTGRAPSFLRGQDTDTADPVFILFTSFVLSIDLCFLCDGPKICPTRLLKSWCKHKLSIFMAISQHKTKLVLFFSRVLKWILLCWKFVSCLVIIIKKNKQYKWNKHWQNTRVNVKLAKKRLEERSEFCKRS